MPELKAKTLVLKANVEFVVIESDDDEIYTCSIPALLPMSATLEALKEMYPTYPVDLVGIIEVTITY